MIKYTILLVAMVFASISSQASAATPDILASVSSDQVSMLTMQEISETRGERVNVAGAIQLCEALNLSFCDIALDLEADFVSVPVALPFGLGTVYLQQ